MRTMVIRAILLLLMANLLGCAREEQSRGSHSNPGRMSVPYSGTDWAPVAALGNPGMSEAASATADKVVVLLAREEITNTGFMGSLGTALYVTRIQAEQARVILANNLSALPGLVILDEKKEAPNKASEDIVAGAPNPQR